MASKSKALLGGGSSPESRPSASHLCSLKKCLKKETADNVIIESDGRVEVRAFEPPKSLKYPEVEWKSRGEAQFHRRCWTLLYRATKMDGSSNIQLSDSERSMVMEANKTVEYHDSEAVMRQEARRIADIFKSSKYSIAFTGAGISTAAGIGDFRGKEGKWTDRDKSKNFGAAAKNSSRGYSIVQLRPTYTHEALLKLMELGYLKYLISQNTDGLHRLSGIPGDRISELHGNSFIEKCEKCDVRYERSLGCRRLEATDVPPLLCKRCKINHRTGRKCEKKGCGGYLMNTIINFGDYLESNVLGSAQSHASNADAVLVLGSTLKVSPANDLVVMGESNHDNHKLVICNRQTTPYDDYCRDPGADGSSGSRVYGDCDRLMRLLMRELMSAEELRLWEEGRQARMVEYGMKRSTVK